MRKLFTLSLPIAFAITFTFSLLPHLCEAQYTDLHDFTGRNGSNPHGSLLLSGSKFYGMTLLGGAYNGGMVFSMDTDGSGYKDIWDFYLFAGPNGISPYGNLIISGNVLFGITKNGGAGGFGDIFSIKTDGSGFKELKEFYTINGVDPQGSLLLEDTNLYGLAFTGGANMDGFIFSIDTSGKVFDDMHDFSGAGSFNPTGSLAAGPFNALYGMTSFGGANNYGCIFYILQNGIGYTDIYDFSGPDGREPHGSLIRIGNVFYGMTRIGGVNNAGCIFSINYNGSGYQVLLNFTSSLTGEYPYGDLTFAGGRLYGMTSAGAANGSGCVFSVNIDGSGFIDLLDFSLANGQTPYGSLTISGENIYGMTSAGGIDSLGTIFRLKDVGLAVTNVMAPKETTAVCPNPSNGVFNISFSYAGQSSSTLANQSITVYNVLGENILTETLRSVQGNDIIDLSSRPNGVYLYRIISTDGSPVGEGKLIIQK
ncbi:MAG TPA: T9SS type A sorting domain-containing protein [Bacteroidia bacterium]|jgi:uncharacterized repeat protein (TIGR03803 family)|nr:T9SS type A sorting domain-containing protein [Bacteroidia bacterium]